MNVYINVRWINFNEEDVKWMAPFWYSAVKCTDNRMVHVTMLHIAVVYKKELLAACFSGKFRLANVSPNADIGRIFLTKSKLLAIALPVNVDNSLNQLARL